MWEICACGIRNTAQGNRSSTNDWNPESKFQWQRLESGIHGVQFSIYGCTWDPLHARSEEFYYAKLMVVTFTIWARLNFREFCIDFKYPWFSRSCRNSSFCWIPFYFVYPLNLVILAKLRFLQFFAIFRNFCYCHVQTWTYLYSSN